MHAHTVPSVPFFDTLFSVKETNIAEKQTMFQSKSPLLTSLRRNGEKLLSVAMAYERLSLLVHLELPCTILIANPYQLLRATVIKAVDLLGENLTIHCDGFNLRLYGTNFYTLRLVNHRYKENGNTSLDIHDFNGLLYASIQPAQDGTGGAVWRDVMENPLLSLA